MRTVKVCRCLKMNAKIEKAIHLLTDREYRFNYLLAKGYYDKLSDEEFLKKRFKISMGKELDLQNPVTFNEKLQWLKLYNRIPLYTQLVDKSEVKKYVAEHIGEQYVIPTLGVWDRFEDIDFDQLPDQFVLKCTHDSGGLVICRDKAKLNKQAAKEKIERSLNTNFYMLGREWPYKNVKPRIMAEVYMEDTKTKELRDYKFFTFNGVSRMMFVASERFNEQEETKFDFYDMDFQNLGIENGHPTSAAAIEKPMCFDEMRILADQLAAGIPHVRVDFYEVDGKVYFGELTFFHHSGIVPFHPDHWDATIGSWITLPEKTVE